MGQNTKIFLRFGAFLVIAFMTITTILSDEIKEADATIAYLKYLEEHRLKYLEKTCSYDAYYSRYHDCYHFLVKD
jgi:hypothetical protein